MLTIAASKVYIQAEWELFREMLQDLLASQSKLAKGNPFTQDIMAEAVRETTRINTNAN